MSIRHKTIRHKFIMTAAAAVIFCAATPATAQQDAPAAAEATATNEAEDEYFREHGHRKRTEKPPREDRNADTAPAEEEAECDKGWKFWQKC